MTTLYGYLRAQTMRSVCVWAPILVVVLLLMEVDRSPETDGLGQENTTDGVPQNHAPKPGPVSAEIIRSELKSEQGPSSVYMLPNSHASQRWLGERTLRATRRWRYGQRDGRAKSFLVIFMGHSGSSAIVSELGNHSQVYIEDPEAVDHFELATNTTRALQFTRAFFMRGMAKGLVPGFKIRPYHIRKQPREWAALVREFDTRIVWQYRNNIFKQAVGRYSYLYYNDTSVSEGLNEVEVTQDRCSMGAGCRFEVGDFKFFHAILTACLHNDEVIADAVHLLAGGASRVHALPYEDYLYDRDDAMRRLQDFLGLKYERTRPNRFKATNDNMCSVVKNWKELCRNFYGCHVWRHMLSDDRHECGCDFTSGRVDYCDATYYG